MRSSFLLLADNVHTFAGVAPLLGELVAQTVAVLYEYVCASAAVVCELAVLDNIVAVNVEQTDRAAYVFCLVAFKGAVGDAVFEQGEIVSHTGADEDCACLVVGGVVLEGHAVCDKVVAGNRAACALL